MDSRNKGKRRSTTLTSLRVVDAIDELDGARLSEIAEYMDLSTNTLYTHLQTLEDCGYVKKLGDTYHLGLKLFHLGENARHRDSRYQITKGKTFELASTTGEEVSFAVEEGGRTSFSSTRLATHRPRDIRSVAISTCTTPPAAK